MTQHKKIKSLGNSDDRADQKTGRNGDYTLGIPSMVICSQFISIRCNDKSLNEIGFATFITKQIYCFLWFQNIMSCLSHPTDKYLFQVKSRNTILICWLWSKSTIKTLELCYAVFIFNFEHIQQINLNFLLLTLNMYLSVGQDKIYQIT